MNLLRALFDPDVRHSLDHAASKIVYSKLLTGGGQTCIAPDYALVHETEIDAFVKAYDTFVKSSHPAGPTSDDYTSIVSERHYARLKGLVDDARAHGAQIIEVGNRPGDASSRPHTTRADDRAGRHAGEGCVLAALGPDVSRQDPAVRHTVTDHVRSAVDLLATLVPGRSKAARRQKAISTYATLVGTMVMARAVDDRALSQEILDAGVASVKA